jgi:hypothetical protein
MYLLTYLGELEKTQGQSFELTIEFRLACSGEFYGRSGFSTSWRSFEMARLLLLRPFELYVVSRPFNSFPQELCLRFGINYEWDRQPGGGSVGTTPPYDDLVEDICAFLTVLSRRLVVPVFETRLTSARRDEYSSMRSDSFSYDHPSPIIGLGNVSSLTLRTSRYVTTGSEGSFVEHTPPPLGVDRDVLQNAFISLSQSKYASAIIEAARAYSSGLQLILTRPELAYQLLISSIETLANTVFCDYQPNREDMIHHRAGIRTKARQFGLSDEQADALAVEACQGEFWAGRKFRAFFAKYQPVDGCDSDEVFPVADGWEPKPENFEKVLKAIYEARSKHLHEGKPFPDWIARGATIAMPASWYASPTNSSKYVPPVTWFERVVSSAVNRFLASERNSDSESPFQKM